MPPFMPLSLNLQGLLLVAVGDVDNLEGYKKKRFMLVDARTIFNSCHHVLPGLVASFQSQLIFDRLPKKSHGCG